MNSINKTNNTNSIETKENLKEQIILNYLEKTKNPFTLLTPKDISKDLHIGINQAYDLFKQKDFPSIKIGKRKTISLTSYLLWKINKKGVD